MEAPNIHAIERVENVLDHGLNSSPQGFTTNLKIYIYQHHGEYFIFVLQGLMFSTQPGEFPGVVPNALFTAVL